MFIGHVTDGRLYEQGECQNRNGMNSTTVWGLRYRQVALKVLCDI